MQHSLVAKNVIKENMLCEVPFYLHRKCISEKHKTVKTNTYNWTWLKFDSSRVMPISYISAFILLHVSVWLNALALLFCLKTLAKMETKCFQLFRKKKRAKGFLCSVLIHSAVCLRWSNYTCLVSVRGRWCSIKHQAYPLLIVSQTWKLKRQSMIIVLHIKLCAFNFSCYIVCVFTRNVVQDVELPNRAIFTSVNTVT